MEKLKRENTDKCTGSDTANKNIVKPFIGSLTVASTVTYNLFRRGINAASLAGLEPAVLETAALPIEL